MRTKKILFKEKITTTLAAKTKNHSRELQRANTDADRWFETGGR
jgi:hypothetical protein